MLLHLSVDSEFLLIQDRLLIEQVVVGLIEFRLGFLSLDQLDLVLDPVLLHVRGLILNLFNLLLQVVNLVF